MGSDGRHRMRQRPSGARRFQEQQQQQQRSRRQRHQSTDDLGGSLFSVIVQFLPLILLLAWNLLTSVLATPSAPREPTFSTAPFGQMQSARQTYHRNLEYFVNQPEWDRYIGGSERRRLQYEERVEMQILRDLQQRCLQESRVKQQRINNANFWWWSKEDELRAAERMETPSCDRLRRIT